MLYIKLKSKENIKAIHWFDKRDVFAMSSIHGTSSIPVLRCGDNEHVMKPEMINEYNKYMNGVNKCDQYLASYSIDRKTLKWWKKIFFCVLDVCILNAMITYTTYDPTFKQKKCSHNRLKGRHFPVSKHPHRGVCTNRGYQKVNGKQ